MILNVFVDISWLPPLSSFFLCLYFLSYVLHYLPLTLRTGPLRFQAGGHKRRPNLGMSCFSLFGVAVFFCVSGAWLFCIVVNSVTWLFLLVSILFSQYQSRDWLGRASPIVCRVGCKTLSSGILRIM